MQDGHFDVADRLFHGLDEAWQASYTSMSEVKELTPEFFQSAAFLENAAGHNFGDRTVRAWFIVAVLIACLAGD